MNEIGKRIKELRKKKDFTQEKLADMLGITYKAVSKWECGMTVPDISMIVPLARLLSVSTDELLGLVPIERDERKAYFDSEYFDYWMKDHEADLEIARQAVSEYPSDFKYINWLAYDEWYVGCSVKYFDTDKGKELLSNSAKHFLLTFEHCDDPILKKEAISGLVYTYSNMDDLNEAKKYAELYPEEDGIDRYNLLLCCLRGEEQDSLRKKILYKRIQQLCDSLESLWRSSFPEALDACETIIKAVITDGNYQRFHFWLADIYLERAKHSMQSNDFIKALEHLTVCLDHAREHDKMDKVCIEEYTCPLLKDYRSDYRDRRSVELTHTEYIRGCIMDNKLFTPLYDREDFKKIFD
ncbi:MAG: helix-turn-helix transcriptional regulator [Clostridia bacterium]|nr:helix-turn-helix transcriptional regulator [Clostridia bacterium]